MYLGTAHHRNKKDVFSPIPARLPEHRYYAPRPAEESQSETAYKRSYQEKTYLPTYLPLLQHLAFHRLICFQVLQVRHIDLVSQANPEHFTPPELLQRPIKEIEARVCVLVCHDSSLSPAVVEEIEEIEDCREVRFA